MDTFAEILKYTLPSIVVAGLAYYLIKQFLEKDEHLQRHQLKLDMQKTMLPVRLQAYERLILLLERISPANLILRVNQPGMSATQLQSALTQALREEFDHNLSQQVYVSTRAWEDVKSAREELISMINSAATALPADATGADLATQVFTLSLQPGKQHLQFAIDQLKQEFNQNFS
jgi:hypothetical protein